MYNFIIVFGLALGIAASLIIAQYIQFELSFDKDYKNDHQIFMAHMRWLVKNEGSSFDIECHPAVAPLFESSVPGVQSAARIVPISFNSGHEWVISKEQKNAAPESFIRGDYLFYADATLLDIFSIELLQGNRRTALQEGNTVVLSKRMADKLFPGEDALDKTIRINSYGNTYLHRVVGIAATPLTNSSLQFNALISLKTWPSSKIDEEWAHPAYRTYIKIDSGASINDIEKRINVVADNHLKLAEQDNGIAQEVKLFPYSNIHFYEPYTNGEAGAIHFSGDKRLLVYFGLLAGLILLISWANYINLTTARSLKRAKEVGLRKVNGARTKDLIKQFLMEFFFMNVISMAFAFTLAQLCFSIFTAAIGSKAEWTFWGQPLFWFFIVLFLVLSTLASGLYPAFVLSAYNPIKVLKGGFATSQTGSGIRKALVLVQFSLSVLLLISIYVITSQIFFMQSKDLGQSTKNVVVINAMEINEGVDKTQAYLRWKAQLMNKRYVKSMTAAGVYPGQSEMLFLFFRRPDEVQQRVGIQTYHVSEGYLKTLGIKLLYGRDFDDEKPNELNKLIISKKSAHDLGFKDLSSVIGEKIKMEGEDELFEVIGIMDNFTTSMKIPLFTHALRYKYFINGGDYFNYFIVKLEGNTDGEIAQLKKEWTELFPATAFDFFFLTSFFNRLYNDEYQFAGVFAFFSIIGVVITCLGLYGLSLYNTAIRTKEIGIRKSLGGSVSSIMWLFSKDYLKIVVGASFLSMPFGIWHLNNWLDTYPNRIALGVDVAIVPVLIAVAIAVLTVGYHTYRAASMNPVNSLRAE